MNEMRMELRKEKLSQICDYCLGKIKSSEEAVAVLYGNREMTVHKECFETGYIFKDRKD